MTLAGWLALALLRTEWWSQHPESLVGIVGFFLSFHCYWEMRAIKRGVARSCRAEAEEVKTGTYLDPITIRLRFCPAQIHRLFIFNLFRLTFIRNESWRSSEGEYILWINNAVPASSSGWYSSVSFIHLSIHHHHGRFANPGPCSNELGSLYLLSLDLQ